MEAFVNGQFAADIKPPILWKTERKIEGLRTSINNFLRSRYPIILSFIGLEMLAGNWEIIT